MPHYYFDLTDGTHERDDVGTELDDDAAARREAVRFLGEVLKHEPERLDDGSLSVDVADTSHVRLFSIRVDLG